MKKIDLPTKNILEEVLLILIAIMTFHFLLNGFNKEMLQNALKIIVEKFLQEIIWKSFQRKIKQYFPRKYWKIIYFLIDIVKMIIQLMF